MRWRLSLSVIIAFVGALGPAVVLLFLFGAKATIKDVGNDDPRTVLLVLLLVLGSAVCALVSTGLMRLDALAQVRERIASILSLRDKREA